MVNTIQDAVERNIFQIMRMDDLAPEKKQEIFTTAYETVFNRVLLRVADQLTDDEIDQFREYVDGNAMDSAREMLTSKDIDLEGITAEESLRYKVEMAALVQAMGLE